jgi:hypothetical protein
MRKMMSGPTRALLLVALLATTACRYDSGWDQGATGTDATSETPARTVVNEGPGDAAPAPVGMSCDLFTPACPSGQACYRYACAAEGRGAPGAHCNQDTDCASGSLCQTSTATCRSICRNVDIDDCSPHCCPHCLPVNDPRLPPALGYCVP